MITFFLCLIFLIAGFFIYGRLVERVLRIDDRRTPALEHPDGVDYVPMKTWRLFLIQLLNIAGLGPIYGALAGACWGPQVYLWIVFGTILGGGVHDFLSGIMSERHDGASISEIVGMYMGKAIMFIMRVFSVILLMLVGINFSVGPAALISMLTPEALGTSFWLVVILLYYLMATFLPIDKVIGKVYPLFGICLIIMAVGIGITMLVKQGDRMPELWESLDVVHPNGLPKWAMMFVTVACGAVSGFHATQSPMMARCMTSEKEGRIVFYGAMMTEGIIALIWAAAGVTFYNGVGPLSEAISQLGQGSVVYEISTTLMGPVGGVLAMIGVIACPITTGDTAFRSCRLTLSDCLHINQSKLRHRVALSVPILAVGAFVAAALPFDILWRYFSWANQTLAMMVLWTGAVFLYRHGFPAVCCLMSALPAAFMSAVSATYILQAPEGLRLSVGIAYPVGVAFAAVCLIIFIKRTFLVKSEELPRRE